MVQCRQHHDPTRAGCVGVARVLHGVLRRGAQGHKVEPRTQPVRGAMREFACTAHLPQLRQGARRPVEDWERELRTAEEGQDAGTVPSCSRIRRSAASGSLIARRASMSRERMLAAETVSSSGFVISRRSMSSATSPNEYGSSAWLQKGASYADGQERDVAAEEVDIRQVAPEGFCLRRGQVGTIVRGSGADERTLDEASAGARACSEPPPVHHGRPFRTPLGRIVEEEEDGHQHRWVLSYYRHGQRALSSQVRYL
ncbi:hypothetical protein C8Q80DRAFT_596366 [Daedaleopsis nitida]|nr:hypothetical protein C8Q80DRAFT_596366 [Daedaleopsis nitida]